MAKLNQIIAAEAGHRARTTREVTDLHHRVQSTTLTEGLHKTYVPKDEEGERLPSETKKVQVRAEDAIKSTVESMARLWDVTMTKDAANQEARADIEVDGLVLLKDAPVSFLLFLEKQLSGDFIQTFVKKLPVLNSAEDWYLDPNDELHKTRPVRTHRTKKVFHNHVRSEATDKHPAQVDVYQEDVTVGYWDTAKMSGALPKKRIDEIADRLHRLQEAVQHAREKANSIEAPSKQVGETLLQWLFA